MDAARFESFCSFLVLQAWAQSKFILRPKREMFKEDRQLISDEMKQKFTYFLQKENIDPINGVGISDAVAYMPLYSVLGVHERYILETIYERIHEPGAQLEAMFAFTVNRRREVFDAILPFLEKHGVSVFSEKENKAAYIKLQNQLRRMQANGQRLGTEKGTYLHVPKFTEDEKHCKPVPLRYDTGQEALEDLKFNKNGYIGALAENGRARKAGLSQRFCLAKVNRETFKQLCAANYKKPCTIALREKSNFVKWLIRRMAEFAELGREVFDYMETHQNLHAMDICKFIAEKNRERKLGCGDYFEKIFTISLHLRFPERRLASNESQVGSTNAANALKLIYPQMAGLSAKDAHSALLRDKLMPDLRARADFKRAAELSHKTAIEYSMKNNKSYMQRAIEVLDSEGLEAGDVQVNLCEWLKFERYNTQRVQLGTGDAKLLRKTNKSARSSSSVDPPEPRGSKIAGKRPKRLSVVVNDQDPEWGAPLSRRNLPGRRQKYQKVTAAPKAAPKKRIPKGSPEAATQDLADDNTRPVRLTRRSTLLRVREPVAKSSYQRVPRADTRPLGSREPSSASSPFIPPRKPGSAPVPHPLRQTSQARKSRKSSPPALNALSGHCNEDEDKCREESRPKAARPKAARPKAAQRTAAKQLSLQTDSVMDDFSSKAPGMLSASRFTSGSRRRMPKEDEDKCREAARPKAARPKAARPKATRSSTAKQLSLQMDSVTNDLLPKAPGLLAASRSTSGSRSKMPKEEGKGGKESRPKAARPKGPGSKAARPKGPGPRAAHPKGPGPKAARRMAAKKSLPPKESVPDCYLPTASRLSASSRSTVREQDAQEPATTVYDEVFMRNPKAPRRSRDAKSMTSRRSQRSVTSGWSASQSSAPSARRDSSTYDTHDLPPVVANIEQSIRSLLDRHGPSDELEHTLRTRIPISALARILDEEDDLLGLGDCRSPEDVLLKLKPYHIAKKVDEKQNAHAIPSLTRDGGLDDESLLSPLDSPSARRGDVHACSPMLVDEAGDNGDPAVLSPVAGDVAEGTTSDPEVGPLLLADMKERDGNPAACLSVAKGASDAMTDACPPTVVDRSDDTRSDNPNNSVLCATKKDVAATSCPSSAIVETIPTSPVIDRKDDTRSDNTNSSVLRATKKDVAATSCPSSPIVETIPTSPVIDRKNDTRSDNTNNSVLCATKKDVAATSCSSSAIVEEISKFPVVDKKNDTRSGNTNSSVPRATTKDVAATSCLSSAIVEAQPTFPVPPAKRKGNQKGKRESKRTGTGKAASSCTQRNKLLFNSSSDPPARMNEPPRDTRPTTKMAAGVGAPPPGEMRLLAVPISGACNAPPRLPLSPSARGQSDDRDDGDRDSLPSTHGRGDDHHRARVSLLTTHGQGDDRDRDVRYRDGVARWASSPSTTRGRGDNRVRDDGYRDCQRGRDRQKLSPPVREQRQSRTLLSQEPRSRSREPTLSSREPPLSTDMKWRTTDAGRRRSRSNTRGRSRSRRKRRRTWRRSSPGLNEAASSVTDIAILPDNLPAESYEANANFVEC